MSLGTCGNMYGEGTLYVIFSVLFKEIIFCIFFSSFILACYFSVYLLILSILSAV